MCSYTPRHPDQTTSKFDLTFSITETAQGIQGSVEYCTDLYNEETIVRMIGHYEQLLRFHCQQIRSKR